MRRLDYARAVKTPYELACCARRAGSAPAGTGPRIGLHGGCLGVRHRLAFLEACGQREQEPALQPHHRAERGRRGAALPRYWECTAARAALAPDRCRREFAGYASDITRTHSVQDADFAALIGRMDQMQQALWRRCARRRRLARGTPHATGSPGNCCVRQNHSLRRRRGSCHRGHERVSAARYGHLLGSRCMTSAASCAARGRGHPAPMAILTQAHPRPRGGVRG